MTLNNIIDLWRAHARKEDGQTMAEYAVVLAVITVLCVAAFTALSGAVQQAIRDVIPFL